MNFIGKKILFISVKTFDYEIYIVKKLQNLGADVIYFDERPSNTLFAKGLIRIKKKIYSKINSNYYNSIFKEISNKRFDYFFLIKGEVIPVDFIKKFKLLNPSCILIFYTWDSFKNNPNGLLIMNYFDNKFTFDFNDSIAHKINFRPLFFLDQYDDIRTKSNIENIKQNLLFIGTAHSDRYVTSQNLVNWCKLNNIDSYMYYYIPSVFVFFFKLIFEKTFSSFKLRHLKFKSLNLIEILNLYKSSTIILDINHPFQSGLTMRTFEALGAGKKLITTNGNIRKYPFYNINNVLVISRNENIFPETFFQSKYLEYDSEFYKYYSIEGWLLSIFFDESKLI
jgi:hypothetical protein